MIRIVAQGSEPHLPIETRLMGRDETRRAVHVPDFPFELIRLPLDAVLAAFDDDFRAFGRHDGKETVAVDEIKWPEPFEESDEPARPVGTGAEQPADWLQREEGNDDGQRRSNPV